MTVFSTGFFSLSKEDIDNFDNSPSGLEKNNKYNKTISVYSYICFVSINALGFFGFFGITICFFAGKTKTKIIVLNILTFITLLITICGLLELIFGNKIFKMSSNVPKFFSNHQDEMKSSYGSAHFWRFLYI